MIQRLAAAYFGGAAGALLVALALWIAGRAALTTAIGVEYAPLLTWRWLSGLVLGGSLWGLGYPLVRGRGLGPTRSGLILAIFPALAHLFYFLPRAGYEMLGVGMGALTPLVVLASCGVWGYVVARVGARMGT